MCEGGTAELPAETEILHDLSVAVHLGRPQIIEQPAALAHHTEESAPRGVVPLVDLEVVGEVMDLLGQQGNLDLGRARVPFVDLELANDALLLLLGQSHLLPPAPRYERPRHRA